MLDVIFTQDAVPKFGNDQIWLAGIDLLKVALGNLNQRVSIDMGGEKDHHPYRSGRKRVLYCCKCRDHTLRRPRKA